MSQKPYKECECCGNGNGYTMKRIEIEPGKWEKYKADCTVCNGFGILIRDPSRDSVERGLGYRKMRGLFAA